MSPAEGFLTLLSIQKGYKYTQLKWLWIALSVFCGIAVGALSWIYYPQLVIPACLAGTVLGAALFFVVLKWLPINSKGKV